jgi:hypothetical protein
MPRLPSSTPQLAAVPAAMQLLPTPWLMRTGSALPRLDSNNSRPGKRRQRCVEAVQVAIRRCTRIALRTIESISNLSSGNENSSMVDSNNAHQVYRLSSTRQTFLCRDESRMYSTLSIDPCLRYLRTVTRFSAFRRQMDWWYTERLQLTLWDALLALHEPLRLRVRVRPVVRVGTFPPSAHPTLELRRFAPSSASDPTRYCFRRAPWVPVRQ